MGMLFCIISAGKAKCKTNDCERRALKLFRYLHGSYLNCTWAFADSRRDSEPHCNGKYIIFYENINSTTTTQVHCTLFIQVEEFNMKINNISLYTEQLNIHFPKGYTSVWNGVVISEMCCVSLLWIWWGGEVHCIMLPGAGATETHCVLS